MCGFGGELRLDGAPGCLEAISAMSPHLKARGPDGSGTWSSGPFAVIHHRLKVIDLSDGGAQPMVDRGSGVVLVFNGCVYNHRELRSDLARRGHRFTSVSDTEVLLKAYLEWGVSCVEHFSGMFAFALFDPRTARLVLARDRLGIKPLYYAEQPGGVRFASTLPALLAAGGPDTAVDTQVDPVALHHYLSWHSVVPAPRTILRGVRKLPPATVRTIDADGRREDLTFWSPIFTRTRPALDEHEWREAVLEALRRAVARRMVADVPVGVLLSGGLDSSLIVALLAEGGQEHLKTFSIGFSSSGGQRGDEFAYSDLVAEKFGTDHLRIPVPDDRLVCSIGSVVSAMSEPMVSHDCVAFYLLSEEVSRHVTVVQSGQGADEVFAGYEWYPPLANVPRSEVVAAYAGRFFDRDSAGMAELVAPAWLCDRDVSRQFATSHLLASGAATSLDAALRLDVQVMLAEDPVKRVDNMTMAWGLEARVPFLDHELVELAARCPPELKLAEGGKGILKAAARGIVPDAVIDRRKGYFPVPAVRHLQGELLDRVADVLTSHAARERGLFRPDAIRRLLAAPNRERTTLGGNVLWQIGLLEMWLQDVGA